MADIPVARVGQPENVARLVSFLVSEGTSFPSGQLVGRWRTQRLIRWLDLGNQPRR
jgi:NAD(P)-dependent dehydrogenase (short-subunit alcohol dehydrogenase family)